MASVSLEELEHDLSENKPADCTVSKLKEGPKPCLQSLFFLFLVFFPFCDFFAIFVRFSRLQVPCSFQQKEGLEGQGRMEQNEKKDPKSQCSGWARNETEPETGTVGTVFQQKTTKEPEPSALFFQEPKAEPEPAF